MYRQAILLWTAIVIFCLLLAGCGGEPFNYEPAHELKPGPGIFSGKDGEFTLIGSKKEAQQAEQKQQQKEAAAE